MRPRWPVRLVLAALVLPWSLSATRADGTADAAARSGADFAGLVTIADGRRLYVECAGRGSPLVILEAGLRNRGDIWSVALDAPGAVPVQQGVAAFTRVCAYDRPGTTLGPGEVSRSDSVPMPRTAGDAVADLHALLRAAGVPGPYVLVGHSTGGLIARLYASTHPKGVAGMVLVEAISERVKALMRPRQWAVYDARLLTAPPPELAGYGDLETIDFDRSFAQMRRAMAATPLRPMPLVVLSKGEPFDLSSFPDLPPALPAAVERAWRGGQAYLARLLPGARRFTVGDSSHYIQLERPDLVVAAIQGVVGAARERR